MYVILDIETTGGKFNEEGITEIAIHRFDGHKVVDKFISLVNPQKEIQPFVVKLTGITNKMVRTAPKFHEVAKRIVEITENAVLVAHNAQFDYRILRTEFRRLGFDFERKTLCTVTLSQELMPDKESYSLGKLVHSLGIAVSDRHRANGDALATIELFKLLLNKDSDKKIINTLTKAESLGELSTRQIDLVEQLPNETGTYYMYNKDGELIYLGNSSNIKKKVNKHFTGGGSIDRKLQKKTRSIVHEKTGNDLIGSLKIYKELRRTRPKYNVNSKKKMFSYGIFYYIDDEGYLTFYTHKTGTTKKAVATFSNKSGALNFISKMKGEHQLCNCNLNDERKKNSCDKAKNCKLNESAEAYNERAKKIINSYSILDKNCIITDKGRELGEQSVILIQNGLFKGYGFFNLNHQINNIHILETLITKMQPDDNTTHIINAYLRKRKGYKIIDLKA